MDWFNTPEEPAGGKTAPLKVSELSAIIEELLDDPRLQDIWVRGEITNYTHHGRGHRYFSLSEKGGGNTAAVIKCVMWRSDAERLPFTPAEGMDVIVYRHGHGSMPPTGHTSCRSRRWRRPVLGEKYLLVEQWKQELAAEGCFAPERKRALPEFPASDRGSHLRDRCSHP